MMTKGLLQYASTLLMALVVAACAAEPPHSASRAPAEPLLSQIEYRFAGDRGEVDAGGWTLVWTATMEGDLSAEARWYFPEPSPIPVVAIEGGDIAYYEARWEVRVEDRMILAGWSAGKTVTMDGEDGIWDGHGVVTEASDAYQAYVGRHTFETGPVILGDEPAAIPRGRGLFAIH